MRRPANQRGNAGSYDHGAWFCPADHGPPPCCPLACGMGTSDDRVDTGWYTRGSQQGLQVTLLPMGCHGCASVCLHCHPPHYTWSTCGVTVSTTPPGTHGLHRTIPKYAQCVGPNSVSMLRHPGPTSPPAALHVAQAMVSWSYCLHVSGTVDIIGLDGLFAVVPLL